MKFFSSKFRAVVTFILGIILCLLLFAIPAVYILSRCNNHSLGMLLTAVIAVLCICMIGVFYQIFFTAYTLNEIIYDVGGKSDDIALITFFKSLHKASVSKQLSHIIGNEFLSSSLDEKNYKILLEKLTENAVENEMSIYRFGENSSIYLRVNTYDVFAANITLITDVSEHMQLKYNKIHGTDISPVTSLMTRDAFKRDLNLKIGEAKPFFLAEFRIVGADRIVSLIGYEKVNDLVKYSASLLKRYESRTICVGERSKYEFYASVTGSDSGQAFEKLSDIFRDLAEYLASFSAQNSISVRLYCGYSHYPTNSDDVDELSSMAEFAIFDAETSDASVPSAYSIASYQKNMQEFKKLQFFNDTISKNLIKYHFQPIVSAANGEIFAYEALMRTVGDFKISPLEMLKLATEHNKLRDLERLTLFNTFEYVYEHADEFNDKKLFVNSIPGSFLSDSDYKNLLDYYSPVFSKIVIEITERRDIEDEAVGWLREHFISRNTQIALDDYGTGYSNESNLLKVQPNYIKIDHSIMSGISHDMKKQQLVKNMITFAQKHGIVTLAEGIETKEDLETVLNYEIDLIQGFYTAMPAADRISDIPSDIKSFIIKTRLDNAGLVTKTFKISEDSELDILLLALEGYNTIQISQGAQHVSLSGNPEQALRMTVIIDDNVKTYVELKNCNITGMAGGAVRCGENSNVHMKLTGDNTVSQDGIRVPETAFFYFIGNGNLNIDSIRNGGISIGGDAEQSFGSIIFESYGKINISCNGNDSIGIGGGYAVETSSTIRFLSGQINIEVKGGRTIGIGAISGDLSVMLNRPARITVNAQGDNAICCGMSEGNFTYNAVSDITAECGGDASIGIGVHKNGLFKARISGGKENIITKTKLGICVGTISARTDIEISSGNVHLLGEGDTITAIGSISGQDCRGAITGGIVRIVVRAGKYETVNLPDAPIIISGGNILAEPEVHPINAVNTSGEAVVAKKFTIPDNAEQFKISYRTDITQTTAYFADKGDDDSVIWAYLPEKYTEINQ